MLERLLLTAEAGAGDAGAGAGDAGAGSGAGDTAGQNGASWYAPAESLKTSDPEIWESFEKGVKAGAHKDLASLIKERISFEKKLGTALTRPDKNKPDEVKAFKDGLIKDGILPAQPVIPESPDKYEIKLDGIPEPMRSEKVVGKLRELAHKKGWTNEDVADLVALEAERYSEVVEPALKYTKEQGDKAIQDFAASIGKEVKVVEAYGGAWLTKNFTEEEMQQMVASGFANSPVALKYAARAGLDTGEDVSVIDGMGDQTADSEFNDISKMISDVKHPDHDLWLKGDPQDPKRVALQAKVDAAYKRKYGVGGIE